MTQSLATPMASDSKRTTDQFSGDKFNAPGMMSHSVLCHSKMSKKQDVEEIYWHL